MTNEPNSEESSSSPSTSPGDLIGGIDRSIVSLVRERMQLVHSVLEDSTQGVSGEISKETQRIDSLLNEIFNASHGESKIDQTSLHGLLKHISSLCLQSHEAIAAAYLGPLHSYSHLATLKYFGQGTALRPVSSIRAVFESVARGDLPYGVVPIENSTDGRVVDTLGMFLHCEAKICGEVLLPIHHNLLSRTPRAEITEVHSKPQALSQCRDWLSKHLPSAILVEINSTAAAAKLAAEKHGIAAVASIEAGREYDLNVVDANIEDNPNNVTRFAVLGTHQPEPTGHDKTSILFQLHHRPGTLAEAMSIFQSHSLNLTWIESFPTPDSVNEYIFFIELAGHQQDAPVTAALKDLGQTAQHLTILGSYPKAQSS